MQLDPYKKPSSPFFLKQNPTKNLNMKSLIAAVLSIAILGTTFAQCPDPIPVQQNFQVEPYMGQWYVAEEFPSGFAPADARCAAANYTLNGDGTVEVFNSQVLGDGSFDEVCGTAFLVEEGQGRLLVEFDGSGNNATYNVLGTDYETYTAVYSCENIGSTKLELAWINTRSTDPDPLIVELAKTLFAAIGVDVSQFRTREQGGDCVYDPPPGSCAEN